MSKTSSFQTRVRGSRVFQEQLRQFATHKKKSLADVVRDALDEKYGKELAEFFTSASFVVDDGSSVNHSITTSTITPELGQAS